MAKTPRKPPSNPKPRQPLIPKTDRREATLVMRAQIMILHRHGISQHAIAKEYDISQGAISQLVKRIGQRQKESGLSWHDEKLYRTAPGRGRKMGSKNGATKVDEMGGEMEATSNEEVVENESAVSNESDISNGSALSNDSAISHDSTLTNDSSISDDLYTSLLSLSQTDTPHPEPFNVPEPVQSFT